MTWAFAIPLPPCPKSVLVSLANRSDEDGYCWPGIADLERRTGWKRRAIQQAIQFLLRDKLIEVSSRFTHSGQQDSNLYRLALMNNPYTIGCVGGAPDAPLGVHDVRGEGAPDAPKSSSESSSEQSGESVAPATPLAPLCVLPDTRTGKRTRKRLPETPWPDDWQVEPWMEELCRGHELNPFAEFAHCRSHYKGTGKLRASWPDTFRSWVFKSVALKQRRRVW